MRVGDPTAIASAVADAFDVSAQDSAVESARDSAHPQAPPPSPPLQVPHKNPDWIDLFTDEIIVVKDVLTRIEYDSDSVVKVSDFVVYVPAWYSVNHPGEECSSAMDFYEHAHDGHVYGGPVLEDAGGLYVEVNLPMTTETDEPLKTDTADSVLGSTYILCYARNPANARAASCRDGSREQTTSYS